ncbi:MAG: OB-fold nucleic acid binding domain-containing protein, partial [Candidatus Thermoplasmatota archaeon]|nr:OB-fold nucleic acid binding domain-containing protein [Candidatus Thermoplasmatota archaeon]
MKTTWISDVLEGKYDGQKVELKGWVKRSRGSNKIRFLVLRDSTGSIQCVAKKDAIGEDSFDAVKSALIESSLIIHGVANPDERADGGYEIVVEDVEIVGPVNPETPFPITESAMVAADGGETEFLLDNRHLYLRT